MKNVLCILFLFSLSFSISTSDMDNAGFRKLNETQKAELIKMIANMATQHDSTKTVAAQVSQWADVGIKIGSALGSCARELNVAVNDFLKTPAGKLTFLVIAWKVMASDIIHVGGAAIFFILAALFFVLYRRWIRLESIKYTGGKITERTFREMGDGEQAVWVLIPLCLLGAMALCLFNV